MAVRRMLIAGRYRLRMPVGVGGMGRVWLARDEMLDRDVAVKEFVLPEWMTDGEKARLRNRTLREARSAARLNHPHVVKIYDVVHAVDQPWIVMEYVPSRSLHQVIRQDGPYSPRGAARIGLDVLEAITAAHRAGVLHRDVKPHNVLIGTDGRVVLTDFGLATFVDDGSVTGPGMVVGSPQYVSPERARDGASTVESDLWSFGATLYAAVEGRSPYARESAMATLLALATEEPDPPTRAGPLTPVLLGLLRREPAERLTGAEAARRLRAVLAGGDGGPRPVVPAQRRSLDDEPAPHPPRRRIRGGGTAVPRARPAPSPRSTPVRARSRRLVAGVTAVALLGAGSVAAGLALRDNDGAVPSGASGTVSAPPEPTSSSGTGGGTGGFSPVDCLGGAPSAQRRTPQPGAEKLRDGWALYEGWSYFTERGFHIAVPDGWTYERIGTTLCFRDPGNLRVLSIDPARNPKGDPVKACRDEAARLRAAGDLPGYQQYAINRVPALARAADWEYAYDGPSGVRMHAMTRWIAAGGKGYAFGLTTRDLDWPANFATWGMIVSTFYTDG
ncbi:serine/threonine-protein kinase [Couchioplanes azureus]|uniref:serine/threonine-protein kinase n=1 Tax=Couchioplanes caeruleus TaxID=56438 RepID=UPI001670B84F|nr:serine/threonine-protein kinase [Couchioplanes caeruleus]